MDLQILQLRILFVLHLQPSATQAHKGVEALACLFFAAPGSGLVGALGVGRASDGVWPRSHDLAKPLSRQRALASAQAAAAAVAAVAAARARGWALMPSAGRTIRAPAGSLRDTGPGPSPTSKFL